MKIAISMVRDEEDIIEHTLALMLSQVDHVIVADNMSVDRTSEILHKFGRVTVVEDNEPGYFQAKKMTRLAHLAGEMGAEWVIPFDADEAWHLPDLATITADVITAHSHVYVPKPTDGPNPLLWGWRLPYAELYPKVCFRYHPDVELHMGQHDVNRPGLRLETGKVRHYQYRSLEQVRRKVSNGVAAYDAATDIPAVYGSHWRTLAQFDDSALSSWWDGYVTQPLVFDP